MQIYNKSVVEVLGDVGSTATGLSQTEARVREKEHGPNVIRFRGEPLWRKIVEPFLDVMMIVLFTAVAISLWQGETIDAIIVAAIILISAVIYWVQRFSTERILRALRKRETESVDVYRDGKIVSLSSERLVCGDVFVLHEGQKIPADARLIEVAGLSCDESMLTGESLSVQKKTDALRGAKEVYDRQNMVFQGAYIVAGTGAAVVVAIGNETEFGRLAQLATAGAMESPVQQKVNKLIKQIVLAALTAAVFAFVLALIRGMDWIEALRFVIAFAVSAVPESLPIAITVVLVLGMRRMARKKALVRNMRAIENIGMVTVVATDKTGTLTKNKLSVQKVWSPGGDSDAALALSVSFATNQTAGSTSDPLDVALDVFVTSQRIANVTAQLQCSFPFDYAHALSGNVWKMGKKYDVFIKGAPEKILARSSLSAAKKTEADAQLHTFAKSGYRVIGLAKMSLDVPIDKLAQLPKSGFQFVGFIAIADQLRPGIAQSIRQAHDAGVGVKMITGDHAETAYQIASEINIASKPEQVYDSRKLMKLSAKSLTAAVRDSTVFSRVIPEAKHKILSELNRTEITAMTGDGVNDVPALTNAHVGIAMGAGAQIAKEASDIVLLDNNFRSIVTALREGRIIIANIRRMLVYLLATNAGEVLVTLGALIAGMPLPVVAVQILWINLVTDTLMVIPLGLEPAERKIMQQPPRQPDAPILGGYMISRVIALALTMAVSVLLIFWVALNKYDVEHARTFAFTTLVVLQWIGAFIMRSDFESLFTHIRIPNVKLYICLAAAILLQVLAFVVPAMREALHLTIVPFGELAVACFVASAVLIVVSEIHKLIGRRRRVSA